MSGTLVPENKMSEIQASKNENTVKESTELVGEAKNSDLVPTSGKGSIMQRALEKHKSIKPE